MPRKTTTPPEALAEIEQAAELAFSVRDVATIVGMDPDKMRERPDAMSAYHRGSLKAEALVRASLLHAAKEGSSPAQKQFFRLVEDAKTDNMEG